MLELDFRSKQVIQKLKGSFISETPLFQFSSRMTDLNPRPADYKSAALPAELIRLE